MTKEEEKRIMDNVVENQINKGLNTRQELIDQFQRDNKFNQGIKNAVDRKFDIVREKKGRITFVYFRKTDRVYAFRNTKKGARFVSQKRHKSLIEKLRNN